MIYDSRQVHISSCMIGEISRLQPRAGPVYLEVLYVLLHFHLPSGITNITSKCVIITSLGVPFSRMNVLFY